MASTLHKPGFGSVFSLDFLESLSEGADKEHFFPCELSCIDDSQEMVDVSCELTRLDRKQEQMLIG